MARLYIAIQSLRQQCVNSVSRQRKFHECLVMSPNLPIFPLHYA